MTQHSPSAERNKHPIAEALEPHLPPEGLLLEIASGTGQHIIHFAQRWPARTFQPSDLDPSAIHSIEEGRIASGLSNILPAVTISAEQPNTWPISHPDTIFCANMIHISPWAATIGLFEGAGQHLSPGGKLITYGAYLIDGQPTAPSNAAFDRSLRSRNPQWGLRDLAELDKLAHSANLTRLQQQAMPANNFLLVYSR